MKKEQINAIFGVFFFILLFVSSSYFVQRNIDSVKYFIEGDYLYFGALIYIFILVIEVILVPVNAAPFMPVVSNVYGWQIAALLSVIGWVIGTSLAFLLARRYGTQIVKRFISLKNIEKFEKRIPKDHLFLTIVFLRMAVPFDFISYLLGLFSRINFRTYLLATTLGVIPMTIFLSILGILPLLFQLMAIGFLLIMFIAGYYAFKAGKQIRKRK
jgi:uncharacterized membrane protein YdjX (TVP38/TMEM64 family)